MEVQHLALLAMVSTLWLLVQVSVSRRPGEAVTFFHAYSKKTCAAMFSAVFFGAGMAFHGSVAFLGLSLLASLTLVVMWLVPYAANYEKFKQEKHRHDGEN
jgi:hypothetical protein